MIDKDRYVEIGGPCRRGEKKATQESKPKGKDSVKMHVSHKVPSPLSVYLSWNSGRDYNLLLLI